MKYTGNELCDLCIEIMKWWSDNTFLTYGEINVLLYSTNTCFCKCILCHIYIFQEV